MKRIEEPDFPPGSDHEEIVRIWRVDDNVVFAIDGEAYENPGMWGVVLADLARHIVKARAFSGVGDDEDFARILQVLYAEIENPTE